MGPKRRVTYPSVADGNSKTSTLIAYGIVKRLGCTGEGKGIPGQAAGRLFEQVTKDFVEQALNLLYHLRPGKWVYSTQSPISHFDQYEHLASLASIVAQKQELASALGTDYIITPDIVVCRQPVSDETINQQGLIIDASDFIAELTPLREVNLGVSRPILHASISCKWTIRSDRAQNARAEALNLIRKAKANEKAPVKILAGGGEDFNKKLTVKANAFSKTAKEMIEKSGGTAEVI